jgi:hypothetical protein
MNPRKLLLAAAIVCAGAGGQHAQDHTTGDFHGCADRRRDRNFHLAVGLAPATILCR